MYISIEGEIVDFSVSDHTFSEIAVLKLVNENINCGKLEVTNTFGNDPQLLPVLEKLNQYLLFSVVDDCLQIQTKASKIKITSPVLNQIFQINEQQLSAIKTRSHDKRSFEFNLINTCFQNYQPRALKKTLINCEEDYIAFVNDNFPFDIIHAHGKVLSRKDFEQVYRLLFVDEVDFAMLNFAIDYAIVTSHYNNLNYAFIDSLVGTWKRKNIASVKEALQFNEQVKELKANSGSKFVQPIYEEEEDQELTLNINKIFTEDNAF